MLRGKILELQFLDRFRCLYVERMYRRKYFVLCSAHCIKRFLVCRVPSSPLSKRPVRLSPDQFHAGRYSEIDPLIHHHVLLICVAGALRCPIAVLVRSRLPIFEREARLLNQWRRYRCNRILRILIHLHLPSVLIRHAHCSVLLLSHSALAHLLRGTCF